MTGLELLLAKTGPSFSAVSDLPPSPAVAEHIGVHLVSRQYIGFMQVIAHLDVPHSGASAHSAKSSWPLMWSQTSSMTH